MLATSPRERCWLAWRTLGIHLSLANLKWELPLLVQVLPGQAWRSDSSRCYLHQAVQSTSRWDRAVLGRATEFCSSQPSYCPALEAPLTPSFSPACLPACSPAPEGVLFLLCNPSGFESSNTHLVRVCAHAYMFTCMHMLVVARVQHLASSSITNNRFFLFLFFFFNFETESLWACSSFPGQVELVSKPQGSSCLRARIESVHFMPSFSSGSGFWLTEPSP